MKKTKTTIIGIICLFLSLIFIFIGISYAVFNYFGEGMTNNVIETGRIIFSYSDANGGTNGIKIENAIPVPDDMGKKLTGENEYFDFSVTASTTSTDIAYEVTAKKGDDSTLSDEYVKIYLTTINGTQEVETPLSISNDTVVTYNELSDTTNPLLSGKTIYYGTVNSGEVAYGMKFRLRMWIKDGDYGDYTELNDKIFTVKVNVAATNSY